MRVERRRRIILTAIVLIAAIAAAGLQLRATAILGGGLAPDSTWYVQGARQLANGHGFSQGVAGHADQFLPILWFPPAYSTLLSLGARGHLDVLAFGRILSAACFAIAIALAGFIIVRACDRSIVITTIALLVLCIAPDQLEVFSQLLSEPMFIVAAVLALIGFANAVNDRSRHRRSWIVITAAATSLAAMTRYLGLVLVPLGFGLLLLRRTTGPSKQKCIDLAIFGPIALAANAYWAFRNHLAGSSTGRPIAWHPANDSHLLSAAQTLSRWLIPLAPADSAKWWPFAATLAAAIVASWCLALRRSARAIDPLIIVLLAFIPTYFVGLLLAISTIDAAAPTDYRLLSPLFIPSIALTAFAANELLRDRVKAIAASARVGFAIVGGLTLSTGIVRTPAWISRARSVGEGLGYASKRWHDSRAMRLLHRIPDDVPTFTNAPDAAYLRAGEYLGVLPSRLDRAGVNGIAEYPSQIETVRQTLLQNKGAVVYFVNVLRRGMPTADDLDRDLHGLKRIEFRSDAVIYAHPATARKIVGDLKPSTAAATTQSE